MDKLYVFDQVQMQKICDLLTRHPYAEVFELFDNVRAQEKQMEDTKQTSFPGEVIDVQPQEQRVEVV